MKNNTWWVCLFAGLLTMSCGEDEGVGLDAEQQIIDYLLQNDIDAERSPSGLYYVIEEPGGNERPNASSTVVIDLEGRYIDGSIFESTYDSNLPIVFDVQDFIPGFLEGIQLFGRGGKGKLIIHPDLAFGLMGSSTIPPNAVLIFDLDLYDFYDDPVIYNERLISTYLAENNLTAERTSSGLYYLIEVPGEDPFPEATSMVTAEYTGYLLNGTVFDSSEDRGMPLTFSLGGVIQGWQEGIPFFGTGGKGKLFIPSHLAYGRTGSPPNIGPDTPIVFEVEVVSVQ